MFFEYWQPSPSSSHIFPFLLVGITVEVLQYFTALPDLSVCDFSIFCSASLGLGMTLLKMPTDLLSKPHGPRVDTIRENSVAWAADDTVDVVSKGACEWKESLQLHYISGKI